MSNWLQHLPKYWRNRNAITYLLWPIELIYKMLIGLRKLAFAIGFYKQHQVNATVIVVGNIVAGGCTRSATEGPRHPAWHCVSRLWQIKFFTPSCHSKKFGERGGR
jgi:hypothetical protein